MTDRDLVAEAHAAAARDDEINGGTGDCAVLLHELANALESARADGRIGGIKEAVALLEAEAPERFRRGSWLGFLGSYWGWRAAIDRLRALADEAGGAGC